MSKKKLTLPTAISVLGQDFEIVDKKLASADGEEENYGECDGGEATIYIDLSKHKSQEQVESTLLHETLHAALYISGQSEHMSEKQEEGVVVALENALKHIYVRCV